MNAPTDDAVCHQTADDLAIAAARVVETFPPITDDQLHRIAAILQPAGGVSG